MYIFHKYEKKVQKIQEGEGVPKHLNCEITEIFLENRAFYT